MRILCLAVLLAAAPAAAQPPAGTRSCLSSSQIRSTTLTDAHEIVARVGKSMWRNGTNGCDAIRKDRGFVLQSPQARYCSGDIVSVFDPASRFEYGACTLGIWEKVAGKAG